ncbi:hypothetical protein DMENIID0001_016370 [Sergentomyia squamirostris]
MSGKLRNLRLFGSGVDISSDDSSSSLTEIYASGSQGRSSIGSQSSIPWAEDAIRQNQLEWERIERIFYGEEELPSDPKTRQEFTEWMTAFPHLRVTGRQIAPFCDLELLPEAHGGDFEEILAIDPPPQRRRRVAPIETRSGHILSRKMHASGSFPPTSATVQMSAKIRGGVQNGSVTFRDFKKVSQQPPRARSPPDRAVNLSTRLQRLDIQKLEPSVRPRRRETTLLQSRSSNALLAGDNGAMSVLRTTDYVPVYQRLEPIINLRLIYRETSEQAPREKASSVLLPAIDRRHLDPQENLSLRSISAIQRRQRLLSDDSSGPVQSASRFKVQSPFE